MPRGPRTRTNLLEATLVVAARDGYARATTRAIAEQAGVSEATIYRHFPDKLALFGSAVMHANAQVDEWFAGLPARAGEASVGDNLRECLHRLAGVKAEAIPLELAMLLDPELARSREEHLVAGADLTGPPAQLEAYLAAERSLGRLRGDVDPRTATLALLATLFTAAIGAGPTVDDCVELLVHGMLPPE
ncbi:TetR family transcriptional regulator [Isoptericola jiangsuensis]|uniref:TetR family transcriptional regulator n=1 Tax=Isoptericola jiangsuensis TaxID=548579 RepID=A0A2A9EZ01_9MICO|nr:TetR/AcrR family transcriptional regulator [Isoptericola jiangsuensis]PFG43369.1 TetR family transcriptional regulator [Isoptericola jiangsuensis]